MKDFSLFHNMLHSGHLQSAIQSFEKDTPTSHWIGIRFPAFCQSFILETLSQPCSSILQFDVRALDGSRLRILQSPSIMDFALERLPRTQPADPRPPIGFHLLPTAHSD